MKTMDVNEQINPPPENGRTNCLDRGLRLHGGRASLRSESHKNRGNLFDKQIKN